jgi:hypothetical protein
MVPGMLGLLRRRRDEQALARDRDADPNPAVAFAVGLIYVFRTAAGARIMRELEGAIRRYAADPAALWRLVHEGAKAERGEIDAQQRGEAIDAQRRGEVIDTTVADPPSLPPTEE